MPGDSFDSFFETFDKHVKLSDEDFSKCQETDMKSGATLFSELWSTLSGVFRPTGFILFCGHVSRSFTGLGKYDQAEIKFDTESSAGNKAYQRLDAFFNKYNKTDYLTEKALANISQNRKAFLEEFTRMMCKDGKFPATLFSPALLFYMAKKNHKGPLYVGKHLMKVSSFQAAYDCLPSDPLEHIVLLKMLARVFMCPTALMKSVNDKAEEKVEKIKENATAGGMDTYRKAPVLLSGDGLVNGVKKNLTPWEFGGAGSAAAPSGI